jgi:hypothetical protein
MAGVLSFMRRKKKRRPDDYDKEPLIYVDPELVRDEIIASIQNSNQFAAFIFTMFTLIGLVATALTQIDLSEMFSVATASRSLIDHVEMPEYKPGEPNGLKDVATVEDIYSWILALHTSVATVDWVSKEFFKEVEHSAHGERGEYRVYWDPDERKYRIPGWMKKFVVKQRSWIVAGWQMKQERLAVQLCDSQDRNPKKTTTGATERDLMFTDVVDTDLDTDAAHLIFEKSLSTNRYDVGGCPRFKSACDAKRVPGALTYPDGMSAPMDGCSCEDRPLDGQPSHDQYWDDTPCPTTVHHLSPGCNDIPAVKTKVGCDRPSIFGA